MTTRRPARASSRRRGRSTKPTSWFNIQIPPTLVAAGVQAVSDLLVPALLPSGMQGGMTVLRMILKLSCWVNTLNDTPVGSLGIAVGQRNNLGGFPSAIIDNLGWYYHTNVSPTGLSNSGPGEVAMVDIRSARKMRGEDMTLASAFEANAGNSGSILFALSIRFLLQKS